MNIQILFEEELGRRGFSFSIDEKSGRHIVEIGERQLLISLENLRCKAHEDNILEQIAHFVDAVIDSANPSKIALSVNQLYWCLEPNDYEECADFRVAISKCVDRVLVHLSDDELLITWVTPSMLETLGISAITAGEIAFKNLGRALSEALIETQEIEGVLLGLIGNSLPFKSSLILAPNLQDVMEKVIGWPLLAVTPDRDFLYLWAAQNTDFVRRVGKVVVSEYSKSPYPISTEVYEITDKEIRAIGAFPTGQ